MNLFELLTDAEKRGARFEIEGQKVTINGKSKLTPAMIEIARRNKEMILEYLTLYNSAFILGRYIDADLRIGHRLAELEELQNRIVELERQEFSPQEVRQ